MDRLWAPWRMEYISGASAQAYPEGACVLCLMGEESPNEENLILHKGTACYTIMNLFPYINGHLMVLPYRHIASLADLAKDERLEMFEQADLSERVLNRAMKPDGFNVGMNLGRVAGAGIADHLHLHIVPRWNGDTNFMPVLGETRVISEALSETYLELKPILKEMGET